MQHRIHQALDGELPADGLTPGEREELHRCRASIALALEPIRQLPSIDVAAEVLGRVSPRHGHVRRMLGSAVGWLWTPQPLALRPALALAGALALALVVARPSAPTGSPAGPTPAQVIVQFRLADAKAREVSLVGDFNGWRPEHRLHRVADGVWAVDVALEPGVYNYVFVVNGRTLRLDPLAPQVTDGFGGASSRVAVLARAARS